MRPARRNTKAGRTKWARKRSCLPNGLKACGIGARRIKKAGSRSCPPGKEVPRRRQGLFKLFGHYRKRELGFGERLYDGGLGVFGGGVAGSSHLADEQVLRAFKHFLFAEGERLAAAEGNEPLEDDGDFEEGPG